MIDKLNQALHFHQETLSLLNRRQHILSSNIANADTPGYLARDIEFSEQLKSNLVKRSNYAGSLSLKTTAQEHVSAKHTIMPDAKLLYRIPDQPNADGNTVDMDRERVQFADNAVKYQSSLTFLNGEIKKMMSVIQG